MKGLNGVGGEVISQIIANRPYNSPQDVIDKINANKTVMLSLIKAGAFDQMMDRMSTMKWFITICSEPKNKLTMANLNALLEKDLLPDEFSFERRVFNYNRGLKKMCKSDEHPGFYDLKDKYYDFYEQHFDVDDLVVNGNILLDIKKWDKIYAKCMVPVKAWLTENQDYVLEQFNDILFQEQWNKYASGNISSWEMTSLGFYAHQHELCHIDRQKYGLSDFNSLCEQSQWPVTQVQRICGTVIAKSDLKSTVTILTPDGEVVDVKFNRDLYAYYNRRISDIQPDGTKKLLEEGWFAKGTLVIICGYRRGNMFTAKKMKGNEVMYRLTVDAQYNINELYSKRVGDNE